MPSKVMFDELPEPVKERINAIQTHWREFFSNAKILLPFAAYCGLNLAGWSYVFGSSKKLAIPAGLFSTAAISTGLWKSHSKAFRLEYLELYYSLRKLKDLPELRPFFEKYPFISIDWKGNLVGKKTNPMIGRQVIGRRRIASPFLDEKRRKKWWGKFKSKRP